MDPRLQFIIAGGQIVGDFLDAVHHSRAMGGVQPVPVRRAEVKAVPALASLYVGFPAKSLAVVATRHGVRAMIRELLDGDQ